MSKTFKEEVLFTIDSRAHRFGESITERLDGYEDVARGQSIDLMHNDVTRLDACEECWS
jgi:hypothetical protein